ncbi:hypothetical protein HHL11_09565 [Ramlibacter sp. G-1-2-2]|uniref:UBA domain-containing protein n=1 Tax=Ramlibacter agri TaxID=2728837 RepID=A0A848GZ68_9BURK|nr:hypothetical protein [Ramlibacter agri]NML43996.1 hypothetical protein [Ramlibacter agri]
MIKPLSSLEERDFLEHAVWGCYYEPDDVDTLVELGFERSAVVDALEQIGYSDEYAFPLPPEATDAPLNYVYRSVRATTRGGNSLVGYVTGPCMAVFFRAKLYSFNPNLRNLSLETARELASALGEKAVFPMDLEVMATSAHQEADLW